MAEGTSWLLPWGSQQRSPVPLTAATFSPWCSSCDSPQEGKCFPFFLSSFQPIILQLEGNEKASLGKGLGKTPFIHKLAEKSQCFSLHHCCYLLLMCDFQFNFAYIIVIFIIYFVMFLYCFRDLNNSKLYSHSSSIICNMLLIQNIEGSTFAFIIPQWIRDKKETFWAAWY